MCTYILLYNCCLPIYIVNYTEKKKGNITF